VVFHGIACCVTRDSYRVTCTFGFHGNITVQPIPTGYNFFQGAKIKKNAIQSEKEKMAGEC
jgi:hypothetical protein